MHGNVMSWESHLRVVEHLAQWPVDEVVDFHESLLDHLAHGTWIRTSVNRLVHHSDGGVSSLEARRLNPPDVDPDDPRAEVFASWRKRDEEVRAFVPTEVPPTVPDGWIGIPLHPWIGNPLERRKSPDGVECVPADPRKARKLLIEAASAQSDTRLIIDEEFRMVLRAAPWAYHRITGTRMAGIGSYYREEELVATGPRGLWASRAVLDRRGERVAIFRLAGGWTAEDAQGWAPTQFNRLIRRMRAKITEHDSQRLEGEFTSATSLPDGQLIWSAPRSPETSIPSGLALEALKLTQTPRGRSGGHKRMPDEEFWKHIETLDGRADDDLVESLVDRMASTSKARILAFAETLADKLFVLDRPDIFKDDGLGVSEDVHLYSRAAIVAGGREVFDRAKSHGVDLDSVGSGEGELLLSVPDRAYELLTGEPYEHETDVSYETGSNVEAWGGSAEGDVPTLGWCIRSDAATSSGIAERIRFWRDSSREAAIARHLAAHPAEQFVDAQRLVDSGALPIDIALCFIYYVQPLAPR